MKRVVSAEDWGLFGRWSEVYKLELSPPDWQAFDNFFVAYDDVVSKRYVEIDRLIGQWDDLLADLGRDPTHQDWRHFRPLRLSREEDWSDWLAFLIEKSKTGVFAHHLLQIPNYAPADYALPKNVEREISYQSNRADIIIQWRREHFSHIEVKVGDSNLLKTYETSRVLRSKYKQPIDHWSNFILMLSEQYPAWAEIAHLESTEPPVSPLTWNVVSIALRRALRREEDQLWRAWAYAFVGATEQLLVGYPGYRLQKRPLEGLEAKIEILKGGMESE